MIIRGTIEDGGFLMMPKRRAYSKEVRSTSYIM